MLSVTVLVFERPIFAGKCEVIVDEVPLEELNLVTSVLQKLYPDSVVIIGTKVDNG